MRARNRDLAARLAKRLDAHSDRVRTLVGIAERSARDTLLEQLVESLRRVKYIETIRTLDLSSRRADPNDDLFNPIKAAILAQKRGAIDEAFWLTFLYVHFGKHRRAPWSYARAVYGRLGGRKRWDWSAVSSNPEGFRDWLHLNENDIRRRPGGFGNHRKYESLTARSAIGTGAVVTSYVRWVKPPRKHMDLVNAAFHDAGGDRTVAFNSLYESMNDVVRFGRTARFDYLCMLAKLGLASINPGSTYLQGATGPLSGARLLFGDTPALVPTGTLDRWLIELEADLEVGMQVLEDALCNWQKSPRAFVPFRG